MAMNNLQTAAFETANAGNSAITPGELTTLIIGVTAAVIITWCAWVVLSAYRSFGQKRINYHEAGALILRAFFVTIVMLGIMAW